MIPVNNKLIKKSTRPNNGGKRKGSGRPKGAINKKTLEQKIIKDALIQRVLNNNQALLNAQFSLAYGCSYLYCITTDKKGVRSKPELIQDIDTIERYLSGELEDTDKESYYYITTEKPNAYVIDSLLDRAHGKAQQSIDHTNDGGKFELPQVFIPEEE
jgi:hypothetical protein